MWTKEDLILHSSCLMDAAFIPMYISLTLLATLSPSVPVLFQVSSHGKTRDLFVSDHASHFWLRFANSDSFLVDKQKFVHFYVVGIVSLLYCLCVGGYFAASTDKGYSQPSLDILILLALHLIRRTYECCVVHQWRRGSKMHILGYLLGVGHYLWLPMMFISIPCRNFRCSLLNKCDSLGSVDFLNCIYVTLHHVPIWFFSSDPFCHVLDISNLPHTAPSPLSILRKPAIVLCLGAQYQQYRHHCILADIRRGCKGSERKRVYAPPYGGWFRYVSCPHYLAEFLIYVSFALLLDMERTKPPGNRHWLVLAFVGVSMILSADRTHNWYQRNVEGYKQLRRHALVPFLF